MTDPSRAEQVAELRCKAEAVVKTMEAYCQASADEVRANDYKAARQAVEVAELEYEKASRAFNQYDHPRLVLSLLDKEQAAFERQAAVEAESAIYKKALVRLTDYSPVDVRGVAAQALADAFAARPDKRSSDES